LRTGGGKWVAALACPAGQHPRLPQLHRSVTPPACRTGQPACPPSWWLLKSPSPSPRSSRGQPPSPPRSLAPCLPQPAAVGGMWHVCSLEWERRAADWAWVLLANSNIVASQERWRSPLRCSCAGARFSRGSLDALRVVPAFAAGGKTRVQLYTGRLLRRRRHTRIHPTCANALLLLQRTPTHTTHPHASLTLYTAFCTGTRSWFSFWLVRPSDCMNFRVVACWSASVLARLARAFFSSSSSSSSCWCVGLLFGAGWC